MDQALDQQRIRRTAAIVSIGVGLFVLSAKFWAYQLTNSQAVFSDALESIVNVVAALLGFVFIVLAERPPDENHPYGHGKTELFSAAFEGGLVASAALLIIISGVSRLIWPHELSSLQSGTALLAAAGCLNGLLGAWLIRAGRKTSSPALVASGHHVMSDFITTIGVLISLGVVYLTGIAQLDALIGVGMGLYLAITGFKIVKKSLSNLLDEEDPELLQNLADACNRVRVPGVIHVHHTRMMRSGRYHYIDAHVVVPEFWDIKQAHDTVNEFERQLIGAYQYSGEIHFHVDPCRRQFCSECDYTDCPIRATAFTGRMKSTSGSLSAKKVEEGPKETPLLRKDP